MRGSHAFGRITQTSDFSVAGGHHLPAVICASRRLCSYKLRVRVGCQPLGRGRALPGLPTTLIPQSSGARACERQTHSGPVFCYR